MKIPEKCWPVLLTFMSIIRFTVSPIALCGALLLVLYCLLLDTSELIYYYHNDNTAVI
jgi:hypothetical protein